MAMAVSRELVFENGRYMVIEGNSEVGYPDDRSADHCRACGWLVEYHEVQP